MINKKTSSSNKYCKGNEKRKMGWTKAFWDYSELGGKEWLIDMVIFKMRPDGQISEL